MQARQLQNFRLFLTALMALVSVGWLSGCSGSRDLFAKSAVKPRPFLESMSVSWGPNLQFEHDFLDSFGKRNGIQSQFVANTRLAVYEQLLGAHTTEPDLLELDVVWPSIVGDDLVDLRPYLNQSGDHAFDAQLLANYTVRGRLVALPIYVDLGVLYYRPDLLQKYGFHQPPETWDELEKMATRIQQGERRAGNKDFWGYVWQGASTEAGTCNFLEWQSSAGAGVFIEPSGSIHVTSPLFAQALRRGASWIGTISPPAEYVYREDDSVNIWGAGQTAFMRNWASGYSHIAERPGNDRQHFGIAPMPAGLAGHKGTLGGVGMAVSKYAAHRDLAIRALLELTGESSDLKRVLEINGIPTHPAVLERSDVKSRTLLLSVSPQLLNNFVSRPSLIAGDKYDLVSREYAAAVNSVLRRKATPEAAMAELEKKLAKITGLPIQHD